MKLASAIKKIEKRLGKGCVHVDGHKAWVHHNGQVLSFWRNGGGENHCSGWHTRRENDHSDIQTDYFAGTYHDNLTQALSWLKPPPSKFKKGDTVKFKNTKKNIRWHRANKVGIVVTDEANTDRWCVLLPDGTKHTYCGVRDIGLM